MSPNAPGLAAKRREAKRSARLEGRARLARGPLAKLAREDPEKLRAVVVEQSIDDTVAALKRGLKAGQRWAVRLVFEAARLVGAESQLNVTIVNQLGASLEVAKVALERAQEADAAEPLEVAEKAAEYLRWFAARHPEAYGALELPPKPGILGTSSEGLQRARRQQGDDSGIAAREPEP